MGVGRGAASFVGEAVTEDFTGEFDFETEP